jgi:hypothetical protein
MKLRFNESPGAVPDGMLQSGFENKIMHASFTVGKMMIMASDGCDDKSKFDGFRLALTKRGSEPFDFFHSRLTATADGKWLLSAGWIWHPVDFIRLFDVERVLIEPQYLDTTGETLPLPCEVNTASFLDSSTKLMATSEDAEVFDEDDENAEMGPRGKLRNQSGTPN